MARRCNVHNMKKYIVGFGLSVLIIVVFTSRHLHRPNTVTSYTFLNITKLFPRGYTMLEMSLHQNTTRRKLQGEQKCVIPVINPFDPEIMPYLSSPYMEKCRLKKYGVVDNGILRLKADNVLYASGAYIERNGDFHIKFTDSFDILNNSKIRNFHLECWSHCGSKSGPCPGFCGENGLCCRKGFPDCPESIPDLANDYHRCVPGIPTERNNTYQKCWSHCGSKGGPCPDFCGENGLCCRKGFPGCSQRIPGLPVEYHACVSGIQLASTDLDIVLPLKKEFLKIHLVFNDERDEHEEHHFSFLKRPEVKKERKQNDISSGLNIVLLLFDSLSHAHAVRSIKKSYRYLEQHSRTVIMKGHSIVADGTTGQLCAMLTGVPEKELPEARKGFPNSRPVDNWPWIFKDMHELRYKTVFSEEDRSSGAFHYRLKGFINSPTTHYNRPLWQAQGRTIYKGGISCPHQFNFDYLAQFFDAYKDDDKFALVFNTLLHNTANKLENTDDDILRFYETLSRSDHGNNTVVFFMGDHGLRTSSFRTTLQGKLEERLPFLSITFPPLFDAHPEAIKNLLRNSELMTSHFDIYSTMQHLLTFPRINRKVANKYGKSLFTNIEKLNRTCADAGVDLHWCTCLNYEAVDPSKDENTLKLANKVIEYINDLNHKHVDNSCAVLTLRKVIRSGRRTPNAEVNQFVGTGTKGTGCDSCEVKYNKEKKFSRFRYQINFSVSPSGGEYEADGDVSYDSKGVVKLTIDTQVSRTNLYGDQPSCIAAKYPYLRPFCLCTSPRPP